MTDDNYLFPSDELIGYGDVALAGIEALVAILSIVATVLHYREAKKFNRIMMFHMWHCLFSVYQAILQSFNGVGYLGGSNPLGGFDTCWEYQVYLIWTFLPIHLTFSVAVYYFFAHFDKVFTQQQTLGRRGRQRIGVYLTYGLFVTIYNVTIGSTKYPKDIYDCDKPVYTCFVIYILVFQVILFGELVFLTSNLWKVSMAHAHGSIRAMRMPFRMAALTLSSVLKR